MIAIAMYYLLMEEITDIKMLYFGIYMDDN